jgi:hypothetical protein
VLKVGDGAEPSEGNKVFRYQKPKHGRENFVFVSQTGRGMLVFFFTVQYSLFFPMPLQKPADRLCGAGGGRKVKK